jgi:protein-tyrosine phosphatase
MTRMGRIGADRKRMQGGSGWPKFDGGWIYLGVESEGTTMAEKYSILFVCMGNICRSPTGEGLMRAIAQRRGLAERLEIDSAGTIGYHAGAPPDARMTQAAAAHGYTLAGRARQIKPADLERFDLILAMDSANHSDILALARGGGHRARVAMLSEYLDDAWPRDVPDPYYGGAAGFEMVVRMVETACNAIADAIEAEGKA